MLLKTYSIPCGQINIIRENWGDFYVRVAAESSDTSPASSLQFGHLDSFEAAEDLAESIIRKMQELIQKHLQNFDSEVGFYNKKTASNFSAIYGTNRKHVDYYAIEVKMDIIVYQTSYAWGTGTWGIDGDYSEVNCLCLRVAAKGKEVNFQIQEHFDPDDIFYIRGDYNELIARFDIPEPPQVGEQLALF
jgi:hypothetical protein